MKTNKPTCSDDTLNLYCLPQSLLIATWKVITVYTINIHVHDIPTKGEDSDFIWDFGKLPFPTYLGKYFIRIGKIRAKIHEIGKIKAIFGLGMTPIYGLKNGQIKSLEENILFIVSLVSA